MWKKHEAEVIAMEDSGGNYPVSVWEVRGCGKQALYLCTTKPRCSSKSYPAGTSPRW
jgi:hypothetical protein